MGKNIYVIFIELCIKTDLKGNNSSKTYNFRIVENV
jgi:hypothetical protein